MGDARDNPLTPAFSDGNIRYYEYENDDLFYLCVPLPPRTGQY
jgi:hypothetical protein